MSSVSGEKQVSDQGVKGEALNPDDFARFMAERQRDPAKRVKPQPDDFASRTLGVIMLGLAILAFFLYTYSTINDVLHQVSNITYTKKFIFVQPILAVFGIVYTIFGEKASSVLGPTTRLSKWGWTVAVGCVILGFVYLYFFNQFLVAHGYVYKGAGTDFLGVQI